MSSLVQSLLLILALVVTYFWLQHPVLQQFSLQAFAISIFLYFVSKRVSKSKLWHFMPSHESWEMILATFAFTILIGATGNTSSPFFGLTYVHLFFLVMATHYSTSLLIGGGLLLLHYALVPSQIMLEWPILISVPIVLIFFLFGKHQQEELLQQKHLTQVTLQEEKTLLTFLSSYVLTKLLQIRALLHNEPAGIPVANQELEQLTLEVEKITKEYTHQEQQASE